MQTVDLNSFLTVVQVSRRYRVPTHQVYRAIKAKKLPAKKVGWTWLIHKEDLPEQWYTKNGKKSA